MAGNNEDIQKMYKHQHMLGRVGEECVVRGANIKCDQGTDTCILQLPQDHGVYTADSRPLINSQDKDRINISGFGKCRVTGKLCTPSLTPWTVKSENYITDDTEIGRLGYAVEVGDTATCYNGGSVSIITSGQTSPSFGETNLGEVIEIVEDVEGSWSNKEKGQDFLGHISVSNYGLYNFGIDCKDSEVNGSSGSLFLYAKDGKKLKYMGAYEIKRRNFTKKAKIAGKIKSFNTWVEFILSPGHDYYIELDCPGVDEISYRLVGNQDMEVVNTYSYEKDKFGYSAGVWFFNDTMKKKEPYLYAHERSKRQKAGKKGIPTVIMYLPPEYDNAFNLFIGNRIANKKNIWGDVSNALSALSIGLGSNEKIIADLSAIIGKLAGPSSLALSVISLFLATLPKPFLERLRFELDKNQYSFIKITLFDVNPGTEEIVGGYNIDDFKIEKISDYENKVMDIYGEKYWIGEFGMISKIKPNPNSNKSIDEQIRDNIKKIFNVIEKYLDNKVNSNGKK